MLYICGLYGCRRKIRKTTFPTSNIQNVFVSPRAKSYYCMLELPIQSMPNVCELQAKIMSLLPGTSRSLLVALVGFTVVAAAIAVDAARSSRSHTDNLTSRSRQEHTKESSRIGGNHLDHDADARRSKARVRPAAIATWRFGEIAVDAAKDLLEGGATALDALEAGITAVELDTQDQYFVGLGGLPNADGLMEFDAAVMDGKTMSYGAVLAIRGVITAFSAARLVMERSPHSVLAGEGATTFALSNGIDAAETLTEDAREQFEAWRRQQSEEAGRARASLDREESHDTVGMVCLDEHGNLAAGTSTSGWKFKHPGRVGDAPIVGAGLYCDGKVGAAVATGDGEEILRTCLSFLVVENMRAGDPPGLACKKGIARLEEIVAGPCAGAASTGDCNEEAEAKMHDRLTVAVMAMSPSGEIGAASTLGPKNVHRGRPAFPLAVWREGEAVRVVEETDLPSASPKR